MYWLSKENNGEFGGKINSLLHLVSEGLNVPSGFIVPHSFFKRVLQFSQKWDEFNRLKNDDTILFRFLKIREIIESISFSVEDSEQLSSFYKNLNTDEVIVRSSASNEDSSSNSLAGVYSSIVSCGSLNNLQNTIKQCWVDAFSESVFKISGELPEEIHLLVQVYKRFDYSGIAFSIDISNNDPNYMQFEVVDGNCDKLVDGITEPLNFRIPKINFKIEELSDLPVVLITQLKNKVLFLESHYKQPVDVEWGYTNNELYIVQCRPITTIKQLTTISHGTWISADNYELLKDINMYNCKEHYERHLMKKHWVRKYLNNKEKVMAKMGYFFYNPALLKIQDLYPLVDQFENNYAELKNGLVTKMVRLSAEYLYKELLEVQTGVQSVVFLEEFLYTRKSGYSKALPNNTFYIEMVHGGFGGLWQEDATPTIYIVDRNGEILEQQIHSLNEYYYYDDVLNNHTKINNVPTITSELNNKQIKEIVTLTYELEEKFSGVSVEWVVSYQDQVLFFDLSQENQSFSSIDINTRILSNGIGSGKVKFIDSRILEDLLDPSEVDVIQRKEYHEKVSSDYFVSRILEVIGDSKPIIVTNYPNRTLAPLIPYVSGFIFEKGTILCHLSILIRESGIPAIISMEIADTLKDGDLIEICEKHVNHL